MIWAWWGAMFGIGLVIGGIAGWATSALRVLMKTLAVPLVVLLSRLLLPGLYPIKNRPLYVFLDFIILAIAALIGDYVVGRKLGHSDAAGYRSDSVGH